MGAAVASKSADTAAGAQHPPSSRRRAVQGNRPREPGPGMIEARLALPGQSTPGPDACSLATARADNASSVSAVRHPAWGSPAPALHRPRADQGPPQRTAGADSHQVDLSAQPARVGSPVPSGREPSPPAPPFRLPPPGAAQLPHPPHLPVSGCTPLPIRPGDTEFPDLEPCCGRAWAITT